MSITKTTIESSAPTRTSSSSPSLDSSPHKRPTSAPTNTVIVTELTNPDIFTAKTLDFLRAALSSNGVLHSFCPLKSFSRILLVFRTIDAAESARSQFDGQVIQGCTARAFFGSHTNLSAPSQYLSAPKLDKLFFISPPPSPPHCWVSSNEEPPNKQVHADDLAAALARLQTDQAAPVVTKDTTLWSNPVAIGRDRSTSITLVYHPEHHGSDPSLPIINVEDTSYLDAPLEQALYEQMKPITHTARPPIELMEA